MTRNEKKIIVVEKKPEKPINLTHIVAAIVKEFEKGGEGRNVK